MRFPLILPARHPSFRHSRAIVIALLGGLLWNAPVLADQASTTAAIEQAGGKVHRIAEDTEALEVSFHLTTTPLDDAILAQLQELPDVKWLDLRGTNVNDAMIRHLAPLSALERLHLERTEVGDAGVAHLVGLAKLEYLNLYATKVSDASVEALGGIKSLKHLFLWQSAVTAEGITRLKELLPEAEVMAGADLLPPKRRSRGEGPFETPLATARFVRIELPGEEKILSLAEVEVFESPVGLPVQSEGTSTQSSSDYGGDSARAHDGILEPAFNDQSVSHTKAEANPWWELDLGAAKAIGRVRVINRGDCCQERLEGAVVKLLDADRKEVFTATLTGAATAENFTFPVPPAK